MSMPAHRHRADLSVGETSDRRSSPRAITVLKVVKINRGGTEGLARCRNISDTGMKLETSMQLSLNDDLSFELTPGNFLGGRVVWTNGSECGVEFYHSQDSAALLVQGAEDRQLGRSRSPRLAANLPAHVAVDGELLPTTIANISQRGMLVSHDGSFHPGLRVKVHLANGREREALVQWAHGNFAGLFLVEPYSVMELSDVNSLA